MCAGESFWGSIFNLLSPGSDKQQGTNDQLPPIMFSIHSQGKDCGFMRLVHRFKWKRLKEIQDSFQSDIVIVVGAFTGFTVLRGNLPEKLKEFTSRGRTVSWGAQDRDLESHRSRRGTGFRSFHSRFILEKCCKCFSGWNKYGHKKKNITKKQTSEA